MLQLACLLMNVSVLLVDLMLHVLHVHTAMSHSRANTCMVVFHVTADIHSLLTASFNCCQVYSEGLLVPLAAPDFSMPYNVICLTSTVLAIYIGAVLNTLLRRTSDDPSLGGKRHGRRKAIRFVVVLVVFSVLGVYLDEGLQETVLGFIGVKHNSQLAAPST